MAHSEAELIGGFAVGRGVISAKSNARDNSFTLVLRDTAAAIFDELLFHRPILGNG